MTIILIKVKSCNALLRVLPVCVGNYLKSVVRNKFIILNACHSDSLYLREQGCEIRGYLRSQREAANKKVWQTLG